MACRGALLALEGQLVDVLARDAFERRDRVGADALVRLRMQGAQAQVAGVHHERPARRGGPARHHLGAAGDHEILHARHDPGGRDVDGGDARAAEAVERHAAGADVVAGVERRHPAQVAALLAALRAGAPDDVVDFGGVEAVALGQRAQDGGAELLRMNVRQRALAGLADAARRAQASMMRASAMAISLNSDCGSNGIIRSHIAAYLAIEDRTKQLPGLALEAPHLHLLHGEEIVRPSVDSDARQQHVDFVVLQAGCLTPDVGARQVVAAAPQHARRASAQPWTTKRSAPTPPAPSRCPSRQPARSSRTSCASRSGKTRNAGSADTNWLPVGKAPITLLMRLYSPRVVPTSWVANG